MMGLLAFCSTGQMKEGYQVTVNISGLRDSTIFMAYHLGDKQYISDTTKLDINGNAVFSGTTGLPQGIYMIVLPGKQYFEILMSEDQHFEVSCAFNDYINTLKFSGSDENSEFVVYQKRWIEMQNRIVPLVGN